MTTAQHDELDIVRTALDGLNLRRLGRDWSDRETAEYERLAVRERALLDIGRELAGCS
jgi:hypothetical protein